MLDEATANIDIISQKKIMELLYSLKNKKTIVFITHRLENIKDNDKVLFLTEENMLFDSYKNIKQSGIFKKEFNNN